MTTQIGPNTFINGHIEGHGEIVVEGRVEGSIVLDDTLMVLDGGFVAGDVEVDVIVVEGAFSGTIRATRLVHLRASAQVSAQIYSQNVRIDPGAHFKGRIEMDVNAAPAQVARQPVAAAATAPTQVVETRAYSAPMRSTSMPARTTPVRTTAAPARPTTERPRYESRTQPTNGTFAGTNGDTRPAPRYTEPPRSTQPTRAAVRTEPVRTEQVHTEPVRTEPVQVAPAAPVEREPEPVVSRAPKPSAPKASAAPKNGAPGVRIDDPDELTVKELRDMLKEHDLPVSGTKQELVERLRELG